VKEEALNECLGMRIEIYSIDKTVYTSIELVHDVFTLTTPLIYSFAYIVADDGTTGLFISKRATIHFSSQHSIDGSAYDAEIQLLYEADHNDGQWYQ